MNHVANTAANTSASSLKRPNGLAALALSAVMTLAMLGGIDHLATGGSAAGHGGAAAVQMAKAAAPRA